MQEESVSHSGSSGFLILKLGLVSSRPFLAESGSDGEQLPQNQC